MAVHDGHDVLGDLMRGSLDHCVKCTVCESFCPVSNVTPLFPGPKYVGPQAERFRVRDEESPDASLDYCSGCGICTQVCPQGVHIAEINTQARAKLRERTGFKLRDRLLARPDVIGTLSTPVAPLVNVTLHNGATRALGEKLVGLDREAALPSYPGRTFQRWARKHTSPAGQRRVAYFHGCGANWSEPDVGRKTVELLEWLGCQVDVPKGQRCCFAQLWNVRPAKLGSAARRSSPTMRSAARRSSGFLSVQFATGAAGVPSRPPMSGRARIRSRSLTPVRCLSFARACVLISAMCTPCGQTCVQMPQPEQ